MWVLPPEERRSRAASTKAMDLTLSPSLQCLGIATVAFQGMVLRKGCLALLGIPEITYIQMHSKNGPLAYK